MKQLLLTTCLDLCYWSYTVTHMQSVSQKRKYASHLNDWQSFNLPNAFKYPDIFG